jgi:hypothetical protein
MESDEKEQVKAILSFFFLLSKYDSNTPWLVQITSKLNWVDNDCNQKGYVMPSRSATLLTTELMAPTADFIIPLSGATGR